MLRRASLEIVFVIVLAVVGNEGDTKKTILCQFTSSAAYRPSQGKFTPEDIPPNLCTHIVYLSMGINNVTSTIQSRDPYADFVDDRVGLGLLEEFTKIRNSSPENDVKMIIGVGGWDEGSVKFSNIAASTYKRRIFVDSISNFLKKYRLDGVYISWTFPTSRGGIPEDKENFVELLKGLKVMLNKDNKLLIVDLCPKRYIIDPGYDLRSISQQVDFMIVSAYEYHGPWEVKTGVHAPLRSRDEDNVEFSVNYMIKEGADPSKVLLGLPTFGHSYIMDEHVEEGQYFKIPIQWGYNSPWTRTQGFVGYHEVCYELVTSSAWQERWDYASTTPFAVSNRKIMSYDNPKSLIEKAKLVGEKGLAGVAMVTLDTDDFRGLCGGPKYPLTMAVRDFLNKNSTGQTLTEQKVTVVTEKVSVVSEEETGITEKVTVVSEKVTVVSHAYGEPI